MFSCGLLVVLLWSRSISALHIWVAPQEYHSKTTMKPQKHTTKVVLLKSKSVLFLHIPVVSSEKVLFDVCLETPGRNLVT